METRYSKYEPFFGSWYIKSKIGQGASGEVFLIEREDLGNIYRSALKCITVPQSEQELLAAKAKGMTDDEVRAYYESLRNRIQSELLNMSQLKGNSYVVSYEDHMIIPHEDGLGWDIMIRIEFLTSFYRYCEEHELRTEDVLKLGIDLTKALELCERKSIIHRDIKPENIFVSSNGDFKLGDFGVSKMIEETRVGYSLRGTYSYMAPEIYKGEAYGPRTDIYSLGLVLYKYLNGGRNVYLPDPGTPFTQEDEDRAFFRRMSGSALPPPANGSDAFKKIVLKACAYRSDDRFQSARDMRIALEEIDYDLKHVKKKTVGSRKEFLKEKKEKKNGLPRRAVAALALATVAVIGAAVFAAIPKKVTDVTGIGPVEEILIGDTLQADYDIEPDRFKDETITFRSSDAGVVAVDGEGALTGVSLGEATVQISVKEFSKSVDIKVLPKVTEITGVDHEMTFHVGEDCTLQPKLLPDKYSSEAITYTSSNQKAVSVNEKGVVTAVSAGEAVISIEAGGCSKDIKVTVKKKPVKKKTVKKTVDTDKSLPGASAQKTVQKPAASNSSKKKGGQSGTNKGSFSSDDYEYFQ